MDKIITLIAVALGWLLNELSSLLRQRGEDRRAVGPVLTDLFEIRRRLFTLDSFLTELKGQVSIPAEVELQLKQFLSAMIPEVPHFLDRYEEAVSIVARSDPLLAFRLRNQAMLGTAVNWLRSLAASDQTASAVWSKVGEPKLLNLLEPTFKGLMLDVAGAHGFVTKWRTQRRLRKPMELTEEEKHWISSLLQESRVPRSASSPKPGP